MPGLLLKNHFKKVLWKLLIEYKMIVWSPAIAEQIGLLLRRTLKRLFFVLQKSDVEL
jgi:hypothetical protein